MSPRTIEGDWDEVSARHAAELKGHRVQITVLDGGKKSNRAPSSWDEFERRVARITKGWRLPEGKIYRAEDFYESQD